MNINPGGAGAASAQLVKKYLQKKFPHTPKRSYSYIELQELKLMYGKWRLLTNLFVIVYFFALPMLYAFILHPLYRLAFTLTTGDDAVFYPATILMFTIPGLFLMMATMTWVIEGTLKVFVSDYEEFWDYYNSVEGYDTHKGGVLMAKVGLVLTLLSFPFVAGSHIILKKDTFSLKSFYVLLPKSRSYNEVTRVVYYLKSQTQNGNLQNIPHYKIYFSDGTMFNPAFYFSDAETGEPFMHDFLQRVPIVQDTIEYEPFQ